MVLRKSRIHPDDIQLTNSENTLSESTPTRLLGPNSTTMSPLTLKITKSRTIPMMTSMVNRKLPSLAPGEHLL